MVWSCTWAPARSRPRPRRCRRRPPVVVVVDGAAPEQHIAGCRSVGVGVISRGDEGPDPRLGSVAGQHDTGGLVDGIDRQAHAVVALDPRPARGTGIADRGPVGASAAFAVRDPLLRGRRSRRWPAVGWPRPGTGRAVTATPTPHTHADTIRAAAALSEAPAGLPVAASAGGSVSGRRVGKDGALTHAPARIHTRRHRSVGHPPPHQDAVEGVDVGRSVADHASSARGSVDEALEPRPQAVP